MIEFTESEVLEYYRKRAPKLKRRGAQLRGACPIHNGDGDSFSVQTSTGMWTCHSQCGAHGDIPALEMRLAGVTFPVAKKEIFSIVGRPEERPQERLIEAVYDYTDADGKVLYRVLRKRNQEGEKEFLQMHPKGSGWAYGLNGATPVPYHLPQLITADLIAVAEGEKCVFSLERAGWAATTNSGGAGQLFDDASLPYFKGKAVAVFADNDKPGRNHAVRQAQQLKSVADTVKIVELPELGPKQDVADYLALGHTGEELYELYGKAEEWTPEWRWSDPLPHPNDRYLRSFAQVVDQAGGYADFWKDLENSGLPTPFDSLTDKLGGLHPGEVYVLAANQGQGKTSLALQFAISALEQRTGVLMYSMEMNHRQVFQRLAAIDAKVDLKLYRKLRKEPQGSMELEQMEYALRRSTDRFHRSSLYVSTKSAVTPEFLVEESLRVQGWCGIGLVIVDHMQLMAASEKVRNDYEKFTAISRATKTIASELGVPLLLVSQTSRSNTTDKRSELEVTDLRGSGAIEEDAAGVMLIYYDPADFKAAKTEESGQRLKCGPIKTWLKLGKNRYGPQGTYELLRHYKAETRFELLGNGQAA